ncbi:MAG: dTDP-4-dehydrorhamnose 3,5-epimerase family protein [Actinomycetota bacterium]
MVDLVEPSVEPTAIDGLAVLRMKQVTDERGTVREFFRASTAESFGFAGIGPWLQVNVTATAQGGLRGLHAEDMTKLVAVVSGAAFGAYVDLRSGSATRGVVVTVPLELGTQVLVPRGVANGFQATAPGLTQYLYCFDREWEPGMAGQACCPLDPALGIDWPLPVDRGNRAQISQKDLDAPRLADLQENT